MILCTLLFRRKCLEDLVRLYSLSSKVQRAAPQYGFCIQLISKSHSLLLSRSCTCPVLDTAI